MSNLDLYTPQRQAVLGVAIIFFQNLRRAVNFVLAVLVVNLGRNFEVLGMGFVGWSYILVTFFLFFSFLQYRKFFFYVSGENFVIEKGVFKQEKINVPFARIQSVNTSQNIIQRVLGLVGLKVDTAGSMNEEINIPALSSSYAQELREYLMQKRYEFQDVEKEGEEKLFEEKSEGLKKPLLILSTLDLFKVGFTQNHLRSGLILFAVINGYLWQFEDYLLKPFEPYLEQAAQSYLAQWVLLLPFAVLVFLIIATISSLVTTVLKYYGFTFYLADEGLEIKSGLLNKKSFNVPYEKIQYFKWESNPLRRILGYKTLVVKQAGTQSLNERKLIGIPGLKSRGLLQILRERYPDRKASKYTSYRPENLHFVQRFAWLGILPSLAAITLFYLNNFDWWLYIPIPIYLLINGFLTYKYWQSIGLKVNASYLEIRRGYVFPKRILIPNFKLQNLTLTQSFLQKPRKLSSFQFHTAAGTERLSHLPTPAARELYNYLAFCIESSEAKWM
jgi:putative membrane protein